MDKRTCFCVAFIFPWPCKQFLGAQIRDKWVKNGKISLFYPLVILFQGSFSCDVSLPLADSTFIVAVNRVIRDRPVCHRRFCLVSAEVVGAASRAAGSAHHQVVEPPQPSAEPQRRRRRRRRAAARRELPAAENHREGELRQGQTGSTHADGPRGENSCLFSFLLRFYIKACGRFLL